MILNDTLPSEDDLCYGDFNIDGTINIVDVVLLVDYILNN